MSREEIVKALVDPDFRNRLLEEKGLSEDSLLAIIDESARERSGKLMMV